MWTAPSKIAFNHRLPAHSAGSSSSRSHVMTRGDGANSHTLATLCNSAHP